MNEKFKNLGRILSKQEQKEIKGGLDGGGGGCYIVSSDQGYQSCWYTSGDPIDLCNRVYPNHCNGTSNASINCRENNCVMMS